MPARRNPNRDYSVSHDGQIAIYSKAVTVNGHPALLEIRFNGVTKLSRYWVRLVRGGYIVLSDGGMEWDAMTRILRRFAWRLGEPEGVACFRCGGELWRLPRPCTRRAKDGTRETFTVFQCVECGQTLEGEFR